MFIEFHVKISENYGLLNVQVLIDFKDIVNRYTKTRSHIKYIYVGTENLERSEKM